MAEARRIEAERDAPPTNPWDVFWTGLPFAGVWGGTNRGRRGGPRTRDELEQTVRSLESKNLKHEQGSRNLQRQEISEEYIPGPGGGSEGAIYPDATLMSRNNPQVIMRLEQQTVNPST